MEPPSSEPSKERRIFFPVDTRDHCFLCLVKLHPQSGGSDGSGCHSYYPLQYLSRYLKMNMKRLNEKGPFPHPGRRSAASLELEQGGMNDYDCKWAVALCDECAGVNDQFLELKRQLEKIELEVAKCLKRMHRKLEGAEESRQNQELRKKNEFVWEMREEVMDKCSRKLCSVLLNKVQVPTAKGASAEKYKLGADSRVTTVRVAKAKVVPNPNPGHAPVDSPVMLEGEEVDDAGVEVKTEVEDVEYVDADNDEDPLNEMDSDTLESLEDGGDDDSDGEDTQGQNDDPNEELVEELDHSSASASLLVIRPARSRYDALKPPGVINPATGKYKCDLCPLEFGTEPSFHSHHQSIHLLIRYKCTTCYKIFNQRASFDRHFKVVHKGSARSSCLGCGKTFSQNSAMRRHQRRTGCGKDIKPPPKPIPKCRVCLREFKTNGDAKKHLETVHLKLRRHQCDQCGKDFTQVSTMLRHKLHIHQGVPRKSS